MCSESVSNQPDHEIEAVAAEILRLDPSGERIAKVFRRTFDQAYDGLNTGRYKLGQLYKTEKTHFGTQFEINLQRELDFEDGVVLDYCIAGIEVDCKYSHTGQWMLPIESFNHLVLVAQADDLRSYWRLGVVRVSEENRRTSENRDRKTGLNKLGRSRIRWLFFDANLPPNALLQLPESEVERVMALRSGQRRINELLRTAQNQRISRNIIATVAQQSDYMKRVRGNGGARSALRNEGIVILGGDYKAQQRIARELGAEVPERGEVVAVRVVPSMPGVGVEISETWWRLALPGEDTPASAPIIPYA
ncbi:Restriction endonuclease NaeI [Bowdeniella nasicola]|uniref:Restriction endonuclease NaeI n=1 Tax=Bowdeniella nasicola TaxID=208480 RepID=A0A1H4CQ68_9ACTO|nr:NaeI family type II restriction endonuclease [Bowdeniella nasicola]SEA62429.1 Restriction endonuclease NaeI [Bowdeniella nasicola]